MNQIEQPYKIGSYGGGDWFHHEYTNEWCIEQTTSVSRVTIAAKSDHIDHFISLLNFLEEPFGILYVLVVSRLGHGDGRYQSPSPCSYNEAVTFLRDFKDYFERDARHAVWAGALNNTGTIVYEQHNLIYAYGPLTEYSGYLKANAFNENDVRIPAPHSHNYNEEFDQEEDRIMNYWNWIKFDLVPEVDDP